MKFLRKYRIPLIFYGLFLAVAIHEAGTSSPDTESPADYAASTEPERDEAGKVLEELYPNRPDVLFWKAMDDVRGERLNTARIRFEQAISTGINTNESLLYNYAILLLLQGENEDRVEQAVKRWQRFFPNSKLPDPRSLDIAPANRRGA